MKTILLAQLESVTELVDHAAAQDMRWWFLGLLIFGGAALYLVARYWAVRHDKLSERLDRVQDAQTHYLQENNARLVGALEHSTAAMHGFSAVVAAVKHLFEK